MKKKLLLIPLAGFPLFAEASFPDVSSSHPHRDAINYVHSEGIVSGNPDGTYRPETVISRAAFTKIIVETYFGSNTISQCDLASLPFSDVASDQWFAPYVCIAQKENLIEGYSDGTFRPAQTINIAEASKIISAHLSGTKTATGGNPWYTPYVVDLAERKALPTQVAGISSILTRGQMAEIVYRIKTKNTSKSSLTAGQLTGIASLDGDAQTSGPAVYKDYSEAKFESLKSQEKDIILFFHAAWCPSCVSLEKQIESGLGEIENLTILKVDYDTHAALKKKYGVRSQTTGVFFRAGEQESIKSLSWSDIVDFAQ